MKRFAKNGLLAMLSAAAAVLNGMPNSVRMRFADPNGPFYAYESGFSMVPVGYANWGHMLAGIGACVLLMMGIVHCFRSSDKLRKAMTVLSTAATAVLVLCMVLFGSGTLYSWTVAVLLAAEAMLLLKIRIQVSIFHYPFYIFRRGGHRNGIPAFLYRRTDCAQSN